MSFLAMEGGRVKPSGAERNEGQLRAASPTWVRLHELSCWSVLCRVFMSVAFVIHTVKVFELHWIYVCRISSDGMRQHLLSLAVFFIYFFFVLSGAPLHHTWHRPQDSSLFTHVVLCFLPSHFLNFILKKFQVCLVVLTILTDWKYRISGQDKKNHTKHDK